MTGRSLAGARALDAVDVLREYRERFALPDGVVYLDGNSLGALPKATSGRIATVTEQEWGRDLIGSWNRHDWINFPTSVGRKVAQLVGASPDEVVVTDTTSVNLFRLVVTALEMQAGRGDVLSESGNFPTDLYVCEGATRTFGRGTRLRAVQRNDVIDAIDSSTALVLLTHIHYKTGEMYPMAEVTAAAQARGALVLWDLSHSAGAVSVDLNGAHADFAVGCGYKYLNGGPGAPSFLYVARRHHERALNPISGWHGHDAPFAFTDDYVAARGIRRFLAGTPSIIATTALEVGVDLLLEAGIERIAAKSRQLADFFIELVESLCAGHGLTLVSPRQSDRRGSHVSFSHPHGYEIVQALISLSVIGDFRAPDVMRFGLTPLYTRFEDVWIAATRLRDVLTTEAWRDARFAVRAAVT
jgi:kynureninase